MVMSIRISSIIITIWKLHRNLKFCQCNWDGRKRGTQILFKYWTDSSRKLWYWQWWRWLRLWDQRQRSLDHYHLGQARAAHDLIISDPDTLLARKTLSAAAAPHLITQVLITKLDDVAKVVDLDVPTKLQEQLKDLMLSIVRSLIDESLSPGLRAPEIRQSKGLLRYGQELDRLLIEEHGQLLCYDEPSDTLEEKNLRICLPLSLFLVCFRMGHYN